MMTKHGFEAPDMPQINDFLDADGLTDFMAYDDATDAWEREIKKIEPLRQLACSMRGHMEVKWDAYHWVYETHSTEDLMVMLARAAYDMDQALTDAEEHTSLMNEMHSNCY